MSDGSHLSVPFASPTWLLLNVITRNRPPVRLWVKQRIPLSSTETVSSKITRTSELVALLLPSFLTPTNRDQKHVQWIRAYAALMDELRKYVQEYHTTSLTWNTKARYNYPDRRVLLTLSIGSRCLPVSTHIHFHWISCRANCRGSSASASSSSTTPSNSSSWRRGRCRSRNVRTQSRRRDYWAVTQG